MVLTSTPRVRRVATKNNNGSQLPSVLQRKWENRAGRNYQEVYEIYMKIADKCIWWRHVIRRSADKKQRQHAKKCFLRTYPTMRTLTQIGMDDHLPFGTPMKLERFYYRLNKR